VAQLPAPSSPLLTNSEDSFGPAEAVAKRAGLGGEVSLRTIFWTQSACVICLRPGGVNAWLWMDCAYHALPNHYLRGAGFKSSVVSTASQVLNVQCAALPWRRQGGVLEFLLITTRSTRRWIIPKGWPEAGQTPAESAAREALEEAGVVCEVAARPVGAFQYIKQRRNGERLALQVRVYPLEVMRQRRMFAEKHLRETRWCTLEEALTHISEAGLKRLLVKFAKESRAAVN